MTGILQTSPPASIQPELALAELAAQEIELLPDRETLCGWHCYSCHPVYPCQPCYPVFYCAPRWCYG